MNNIILKADISHGADYKEYASARIIARAFNECRSSLSDFIRSVVSEGEVK
jgi:hypothetical protein